LLEGKSSLQTVSADKIIRGAIALLRPLHSKNLRNPDEENINVVAHYQWYLRGILTKELEWADNSHWSAAWKAVWGTPKQERIELFGMSWTNPFWVLDQLMQRIPRRLQVGVVHGDFHPRNIVLTGYGEPHIIDFGWSGDRHHIAQDFALLECNLRFLVQTPAIPFQDLLTIARWINVEEAPPSNVVNSAASDRVKLICTLRNALPQHFAPTTNWGIQYVVPLFLIGMGLFKHLHECENQVSAHLTVLALGDYIAKRLLPDWPQQPSKI
jgi:hypothetical protein